MEEERTIETCKGPRQFFSHVECGPNQELVPYVVDSSHGGSGEPFALHFAIQDISASDLTRRLMKYMCLPASRPWHGNAFKLRQSSATMDELLCNDWNAQGEAVGKRKPKLAMDNAKAVVQLLRWHTDGTSNMTELYNDVFFWNYMFEDAREAATWWTTWKNRAPPPFRFAVQDKRLHEDAKASLANSPEPEQQQKSCSEGFSRWTLDLVRELDPLDSMRGVCRSSRYVCLLSCEYLLTAEPRRLLPRWLVELLEDIVTTHHIQRNCGSSSSEQEWISNDGPSIDDENNTEMETPPSTPEAAATEEMVPPKFILPEIDEDLSIWRGNHAAAVLGDYVEPAPASPPPPKVIINEDEPIWMNWTTLAAKLGYSFDPAPAPVATVAPKDDGFWDDCSDIDAGIAEDVIQRTILPSSSLPEPLVPHHRSHNHRKRASNSQQARPHLKSAMLARLLSPWSNLKRRRVEHSGARC